MTDIEDDEDQYKYPFIRAVVPKLSHNDPEAMSRIKNQLPVILTDCDLVSPALKWDLDYLKCHIGPGPFTVFVNKRKSECPPSATNGESPILQNPPEPSSPPTPPRHTLFKYYDEKKVGDYKGKFTPDIVKEDLTFQEFLDRYNGDRDGERLYLQQPLNSAVGKQIAVDFVGFNWNWEIEKQRDWNWGPLTSNLLLIGQKGNITPCHYDEQQNLFCQLKGKKKFILFSPENFPRLYPYPVYHPHDRQSQVDFDAPNLERFPNFAELEGLEAIVEEGQVLYIPMYYWHHVINLTDTISINFWHKTGANSPIIYPLKSRQKVAMVRNIEKMVLEALQDQSELSTLLHWLVDGRYDQSPT